jgi:hypothetical protein
MSKDIRIVARTYVSLGTGYFSAKMYIDNEPYIVTDMDGGDGEIDIIHACLDWARRHDLLTADELPKVETSTSSQFDGRVVIKRTEQVRESIWQWKARTGNTLTINMQLVKRKKDLYWTRGGKLNLYQW